MPLAAFVAMGLGAALGAAWPQAHRDLHAAEALLGAVLLLQSASYFAATAATGALAATLGMRRLLAGSAFLAAACFAAMAVAPGPALFAGAATLLNLGLGPIDGGVNAQVAVHGGLRRLGWVHAVWALGAALGPSTVALTEAAFGSWRPAFALFALAMAAVAVAAARTRWAPLATSEPPPRPVGATRWVAVAALVLLAAAAVEVAFGFWAPTDLSHRGLAPALAAAGAGIYYAGLTAGRVAVAVFPGLEARAADGLAVSGVLAVGSAAVYWAAPGADALGVLFVVGFSLAAMVPIVNRLTVERVGASASANAIGLQMAIGVGVGGTLPSALGLGVQAGGAGVLAPAFLAGALLLALLTIAVRRA